MDKRTFALLASAALMLAACGTPVDVGVGDDEPVLQITSEGGFAPVEMILSVGPRFTLLGDGTLIYQGVQTLEYPGRLVPPYMTAQLTDSQVDALVAMVERIGLPDFEEERDDTALDFVADATTEVIRYWDDQGEHVYSVYGLYLVEDPSPETAAFQELVTTLDRFAAETPGEPYVADRIRVIAGEGMVEPEFSDVRPWPLGESDPSSWGMLPNGWACQAFDGDVLEAFADATQATTWEHPTDGSELMLLVRPLHPGEPDCPQS